MERLLGTPRTVGRSTAAARRSSRTADRRWKDCRAPAARWGSRRQHCNAPPAPTGGRFPECTGPAARSERPASECSERLIRRGGPSMSAASDPPRVRDPRRVQRAAHRTCETPDECGERPTAREPPSTTAAGLRPGWRDRRTGETPRRHRRGRPAFGGSGLLAVVRVVAGSGSHHLRLGLRGRGACHGGGRLRHGEQTRHAFGGLLADAPNGVGRPSRPISFCRAPSLDRHQTPLAAGRRRPSGPGADPRSAGGERRLGDRGGSRRGGECRRRTWPAGSAWSSSRPVPVPVSVRS